MALAANDWPHLLFGNKFAHRPTLQQVRSRSLLSANRAAVLGHKESRFTASRNAQRVASRHSRANPMSVRSTSRMSPGISMLTRCRASDSARSARPGLPLGSKRTSGASSRRASMRLRARIRTRTLACQPVPHPP